METTESKACACCGEPALKHSPSTGLDLCSHHYSGTKPDGTGYYGHELLKLAEERRSMLPASPAQEAPAKWVPVVGDTVQTKANWTGLANAGIKFVVTNVRQGLQEPIAYGDMPNLKNAAVRVSELEPAPMPSGSAGKEEPYRTSVEGHWVEEAKPDPYAQHREATAGHDFKYWQEMSPKNQAARKRNIAALARELDDGPGRRARLSRFEPTPWQDWPKGCERNEP